jgi:hypothetical protein
MNKKKTVVRKRRENSQLVRIFAIVFLLCHQHAGLAEQSNKKNFIIHSSHITIFLKFLNLTESNGKIPRVDCRGSSQGAGGG